VEHKTYPFEFKSLDDDAGTFEATVAVFGNVDKGGDRILPGAFEKSLAQWEASGDPIPVIFNHDWGTPDAHIGVVEHAIETSSGLLVKGRLDVDDNPVARQVHRLMQRRSLKEFSFGYSVPKGGEKRAKDGANDLLQIDLAEVGPTLKGMNPATELHSVKSALIAQHADGLQEARELRQEVKELATRIEGLEAALKAQKDRQKSADPLRERVQGVINDVLTDGTTKPPARVATEEQPPRPDMDPDELKRRSRDLIVQLMTD
jgi:hypothetical protein